MSRPRKFIKQEKDPRRVIRGFEDEIFKTMRLIRELSEKPEDTKAYRNELNRLRLHLEAMRTKFDAYKRLKNRK